MSKLSCLFLYSESTMKIGQAFWTFRKISYLKRTVIKFDSLFYNLKSTLLSFRILESHVICTKLKAIVKDRKNGIRVKIYRMSETFCPFSKLDMTSWTAGTMECCMKLYVLISLL